VGLFLLMADFAAIGISFVIASRFGQVLIPALLGDIFSPAYIPIIYLCLGYVGLLFAINNLYPGYGKTAVKEIEKTSTLLSLVFLLLGGTIFILNSFEDFPRSIFFLSWISSIILVPMFRIIIRSRIYKYSWYGIPILYVTDGLNMEGVFSDIQRSPRMGWVPAAIFSIGEGKLPPGNYQLPVISSWSEISDLKNQSGMDTVIFCADPDQGNLIWLRKLSEQFRRVTLIVPYYNLGSLWVKPRDFDGRLGLEITYHLLNRTGLIIKRSLDLIGSLLLILFLSPLLIAISVSIYIESSGPIFFQQERLGKNGECFKAIKFRTMVINAEEKLESILENDLEARQEYQRYHKLSHDPRITKIGYLLRKYSLDELAQLWNVLRGEMSLIGPRAYMPSEADEIGDYLDIILRIRPGMTGWWQVMGRQNTTFSQRLRMDEYYISNWSLWMDLYIVYRTIWVVLSGTGT